MSSGVSIAKMLVLLFLSIYTQHNAVVAYMPSYRVINRSHHRHHPISKTVTTLSHATTKPLSATNISDGTIINESPRQLLQKGIQSFRSLDVPSSLTYFDQADDLANGGLSPYLWQRGISYYYLDEFQKGSQQFKSDVINNPLDVEEIVWDIACLARIRNDNTKEWPPQTTMELPKGKKDRRKIMSTVYSLFRGDGMTTEHDLFKAGHDGNISDEFYSLFYLGLYCEIRNETTKAEEYMKLAAKSKYATGIGSGDYMSSCAKVHCKLRGWEV